MASVDWLDEIERPERKPKRICATEQCDTRLAADNPSDYCSACTNPRRADKWLMRIAERPD